MNYETISKQAKAQARDILRAQMAMRIQERASNARKSLVNAISFLASVLAGQKREEKKAAEERENNDKIRSSIRAEYANLGLTEDEILLMEEADAKEDSIRSKAETESNEQRAKSFKEKVEQYQKGIKEERENYAHHKENLAKLEAGELKVDKEEMLALANKLIEEGRVITSEEN